MLLAASALKGYAIQATDGRMGWVDDTLFDDQTWKIRWMVIKTGSWLSERKVLIHPSAIQQADFASQVLTVALSKSQVEASPDLGQDEPVSRQMESLTFGYYGWNPHWGPNFFPQGMVMAGTAGLPLSSPYLGGADLREAERHEAIPEGGDPHLRSSASVTGYHIHATDGTVGHIENLLIDDAGWGIRYLVIDTKNWWPGQHVLLSPYAVQRIDWAEREIRVGVSRDVIKGSPPWDPASLIDRGYEQRLHTHYGWPGYAYSALPEPVGPGVAH